MLRFHVASKHRFAQTNAKFFHVFIALTQVLSKHIYDKNHQSIQLKIETWTLLRFYKEYDIFFTVVLSNKLSQQYVESFQILKKIDNLVYKLKLSHHWRIHSVFFIAHLKSTFAFANDFFQKVSLSTESIYVDDNTKKIKLFEIEK